ncbi:MAG: hypothetical protein CMM86_01095 [Rhodovulum sp.]|nr:hypothetical protein [Rhodovulum sp.]
MGYFSTKGGKILILACGALAHEILAVIKTGGWEHVSLACLPAILHNHPEKIAPEVEKALIKHAPNFDRIFVAYADCGTGGALERVCQAHGVEMIRGPHCYAFFEGVDTFTARDEIDAFYLTDFLARQFDAFVWKPLGLDRHPELRDMYFGHYRTLVYLAQTDDPALDARAADCAARLGLAYERRFTGYGDLTPAITGAVQG